LGERHNGIVEVRGSNPLSSIRQKGPGFFAEIGAFSFLLPRGAGRRGAVRARRAAIDARARDARRNPPASTTRLRESRIAKLSSADRRGRPLMRGAASDTLAAFAAAA
jgi:hypothetical protein